MPIDFKSLKKLETVQPSEAARNMADGERLLIIVKLRDGAQKPDYVTARTDIASGIFTAEVGSGELNKLQSDPAVESMSISRRMPAID
ncbi:hypothetical protein JQ594_00835 [Bradyrhizobium manausense]|uniref:hypothetical protein n=1 Tax=Bradyrhizobium manausense TaxID=989370 RepID=UPI001BAA19BF|nr:hypothetical protein [Bradyrhizobium manausense]MBR0684445.1 hypothetical protein [Bradyrhizobium manausense]